MKYTIGLIFTLINVSICSSLQELDFIQSLYPYKDIPKSIFIAFVNRRIDQLNSKCANSTLSNATKAFCLSTNQSLSLLVDWSSLDATNEQEQSNDTFVGYNGIYDYPYRNDTYEYVQSSDLIEFYEQTVKILNNVYPFLNIVSVDDFNTDSLESIDIYNFPRSKYQALIDAYTGDIKLVSDYEESIGNSKRVNMKIVESLNSLSREVPNLINDIDWKDPTDKIIARQALDQCLKRFNILMTIFRRNFFNH